MQADERIKSALDRLTNNEKECLRRRLLPQTAKEMAIDLGISAHAVEKRLKMARAKLGLASSLEAARLLSAAEGYGRSGPHTSDLAELPPAANDPGAAGTSSHQTKQGARRIRFVLLWGAIPMVLIAIGLLALAAQGPASAPPASQLPVIQTTDTPPGKPIDVEDVKMRPARPDEIRAFVAESFDLMDKDHSGFIERDEAPAAGIGFSQPHGGEPAKGGKLTWVTGTAGQALWISNGDKDGDGKMSKDEYIAWMYPIWAQRGAIPAFWKPRP
jgi:DNA-binding CsgD family transcriptional regulator